MRRWWHYTPCVKTKTGPFTAQRYAMLWSCARLSVCPSVCRSVDLPQAGIVPKLLIMFVRLLNCWHTAQLTILTSATQGSTIYIRVKPAKLLPHTAHSDWINRTGLNSWAFTRWCGRHTRDYGSSSHTELYFRVCGRFARFWHTGGAKFSKMGDFLPTTHMNHRTKFDTAFILAGKIRNSTNKQGNKQTQKQTNSNRYINTLPVIDVVDRGGWTQIFGGKAPERDLSKNANLPTSPSFGVFVGVWRTGGTTDRHRGQHTPR